MKILVVHNYYQQPGGEDLVFRLESQLLREAGHEVIDYTIHNDEVKSQGLVTLGVRTVWNRDSHAEFTQLVTKEKPEIAHFHNTFPLLSPSVYSASRAAGAAVVQTLHNYRLFCPGATLFRDGNVCEECLDKRIKWPAIVHGCYRGSRLATTAVTAMLATHHFLKTYSEQVDAYIAVSQFVAKKAIAGGLPGHKVHIKPNCVHPDPGPSSACGNFALYLGRLSEEKGIRALLEAWRELGSTLPLKIAGDGPLAPLVREAAAQQPGIEWLGRQDRKQVLELLKTARVMIVPSIWYEGFPLTVLEAFASSLPVIASRLGNLEMCVAPGVSGLLFTPNQPQDLAQKVREFLANPVLEAELRLGARSQFEQHYTGTRTYERLIEIYTGCLANRQMVGKDGKSAKGFLVSGGQADERARA